MVNAISASVSTCTRLRDISSAFRPIPRGNSIAQYFDEVGENRSLLVCCSAFRVKDTSQFPNLTIKKIPKMVLNRCEWGRDDYSLEIKNLPEAPPIPEPAPVAPTNGRRKSTNGSMNLFEAAVEGSPNR